MSSNATRSSVIQGLKNSLWHLALSKPLMTERCSDVVGTEVTEPWVDEGEAAELAERSANYFQDVCEGKYRQGPSST